MNMRNDKPLNEYELFLTDDFAKTKSKWGKYINLIAYKFLNSFYDNLFFMNDQMKIINKRKDASISYKEQIKLKRFLNVFALFDMIEINSKEKKIFVNIDKIDKEFSQVTSAKERSNIKEGLKELDSSFNNQKDKTIFSNLYYNYNFLISYIKNEDFRKAFYKEFLLQDDKDNVNAFLKNNLYVSKTI